MSEKTVVSVYHNRSEHYYCYICYNDKQLEKLLAKISHPSNEGKYGEPYVSVLNEAKTFGTGTEEAYE